MAGNSLKNIAGKVAKAKKVARPTAEPTQAKISRTEAPPKVSRTASPVPGAAGAKVAGSLAAPAPAKISRSESPTKVAREKNAPTAATPATRASVAGASGYDAQREMLRPGRRGPAGGGGGRALDSRTSPDPRKKGEASHPLVEGAKQFVTGTLDVVQAGGQIAVGTVTAVSASMSYLAAKTLEGANFALEFNLGKDSEVLREATRLLDGSSTLLKDFTSDRAVDALEDVQGAFANFGTMGENLTNAANGKSADTVSPSQTILSSATRDDLGQYTMTVIDVVSLGMNLHALGTAANAVDVQATGEEMISFIQTSREHIANYKEHLQAAKRQEAAAAAQASTPASKKTHAQ